LKMKYFKRIAGIALSAAVVLTSMTALAAGQVTWQVKDYIDLGSGAAFEIAYEQYLDGVATGYVVSGNTARDYGLKGFASSITHPVNWYDSAYPNLQYREVWADGQYTGLVQATGAHLPYTAYKNFPYAWEVGGTHKILAETRANFGGTYIGNANGGANYPTVYTGANADVIEENVYYGFDVFEVYANGKARDVEVVLDTEGNGVNGSNPIKANLMTAAANENTVNGSITGLVNSGAGVNSAFYAKLAADSAWAYAGQRSNTDRLGQKHEVPMFNYTDAAANTFDNLLSVTHSFQLTGPVFGQDGTIAAGNEYALKIDAYEDVVSADKEVIDAAAENNGDKSSGDWDYAVDATRYSYYTNNLVTTAPAKATADWVYAGYELEAPYRMFEYLSVEGIIFDGDIDNDGNFDTPVIFRYLKNNANGDYALANPKVEWNYAFVDATYPHEIYMQKSVEDMNGNMVKTGELRGTDKYAKANYAAEIHPANGVNSGDKHVQARLEWRANNGDLYMTPYFDINNYVGSYIELSSSPDPDYIGAYNFVVPGTPVVLDPATIISIN